ncbi:MAG: hypothetical protein KF869_07005 [Phycisphaeraceae bacterium]|nr:hypothetical protein [Phycisphaeraceae bacterium]
MYLPDDLLDTIAAGLERCEADLRAEHAVHGLDALPEVRFHALLADALGSLPLGILREQPYPHEWSRKRRGGSKADPSHSPALDIGADPDMVLAAADPITGELPDPRDRMRCDLVLTPAPGLKLGDPLALVKTTRARQQQAAGTLFAAVEAAQNPPEHGPDACAPEDACWLEVKLVGQFTYSAGVAGPNSSYASELTRGPAADIRKLSADGRIRHAAAMVLLFTNDRATAEHDLAQMLHRCLDRGLPIAAPLRREVPVTDRIGNNLLTICMIPVRTAV